MGMKIKKAALLLSVFILNLMTFRPVYATTATPQISTEIESFIQQGLPNASVGVVVLEADSGKTLFERHAKEPFPPASTTKLFTAAASLLSLGANYKFQTLVKIDKKELQQNTQNGNVYVEFSGDPSLTIRDVKQLIADIKTAGIQQINGNIVIDESRFQSPNYPMGWAWESTAWYYQAPVTTIILNQNKVPITLTSNKTLGQKTDVVLASNEEPLIKLHSDVVTVTQAESETHCQIEVQMDELNQLNLKGCWPQQSTPMTLNVALKNPLLLAEKIIRDALHSEKIVLTGKIVTGKVNQDLTTIASHDSKPLKELLEKVLEDSNNLYSESLTKTLGVAHFKRGTFHAGILAMKEILSKPTGIDFTTLRLMDGSGCSEYNLIQPYQLDHLLFAMEHDKTVGQDFKEALPVSGSKNEKSTLYTRFKFADSKDRIRAKSGTKKGVSALAGYLTTNQNKKLIFVIMVDHFLDSSSKIKQFEDEFCRLLINSK
jgi:D-alanyl-D-alanine carboxypeptidase/D-alanyl-D-alanine-endopeptidase (penicillin-binding protein 4)